MEPNDIMKASNDYDYSLSTHISIYGKQAETMRCYGVQH